MRAIDPRLLVRNANSVDTLRTQTKALRHDLRSIGEALTGLTTQLGMVQLQMEQLVTLRREELDAPARMDRLERILDADRIRAHIREAVARTDIVEDPVPHGVVCGLLPDDVYGAAIDAIPSPVFFDGGEAGAQELRVPPGLAPTYSIATWTFLADMVDAVLGPALVERFRGPLDRHVRTLCPSLVTPRDAGVVLTAGPGRIVLRRPGREAPAGRTRPWHFLTVVVDLASAGDGEGYGSRLRSRKEIPFRANSALVVLDADGAHEYASIPEAAAATVRYTYEFAVGPDTHTRQFLLGRMSEGARRSWEAWKKGVE